MSNELAVIGRENFLCLNETSPQVRALRANTRFSPIKSSDLVSVKNPSGGSLAWEIESARGATYEKELRGVILHAAGRRVLWASRNVGSGEVPVCTSDDLCHGRVRRKDMDDPNSPVDVPESMLRLGMPGGDNGMCGTCYFNQWGTGVDATGARTKGKRCGEQRVLYLLREKDILPLRLRVPAGSIGAFDQWMKRISNEGVCYNECVVRLRLEKKQSTNGADYAALVTELVSPLDATAIEAFQGYAEMLKPIFEKDEVEPEAPAAKQNDPYGFETR